MSILWKSISDMDNQKWKQKLQWLQKDHCNSKWSGSWMEIIKQLGFHIKENSKKVKVIKSGFLADSF